MRGAGGEARAQQVAAAGSGSAVSAGAQRAPVSEKAQKTLSEARGLKKQRQYRFALDAYRRADKQDGGHCGSCVEEASRLALKMHDWKAAQEALGQMLTDAVGPVEQAAAHVERAKALNGQGSEKHKPELLAQGVAECDQALAGDAANGPAQYLKGVCLAQEGQDANAQQVFQALVKRLHPGTVDYDRVARYAEDPAHIAGADGPDVCGEGDGWEPGGAGPDTGQGGAIGLLGDLVRAVPGGVAEHPEGSKGLCGGAAGDCKREPGQRRGGLAQLCGEKRDDVDAVSGWGLSSIFTVALEREALGNAAFLYGKAAPAPAGPSTSTVKRL